MMRNLKGSRKVSWTCTISYLLKAFNTLNKSFLLYILDTYWNFTHPSSLSSADTLQWAARSSLLRRVTTILLGEEERSGSASISPFDPPCGRWCSTLMVRALFCVPRVFRAPAFNTQCLFRPDTRHKTSPELVEKLIWQILPFTPTTRCCSTARPTHIVFIECANGSLMLRLTLKLGISDLRLRKNQRKCTRPQINMAAYKLC